MQTVRETHLQVVSAVRAAAQGEEDGRPAGRRRGLQDQPLSQGQSSGVQEPFGLEEEIAAISTIAAQHQLC